MTNEPPIGSPQRQPILCRAGSYYDRECAYRIGGTVLTDSCFQFDCGYTIMLAQIAWLFSVPASELKVGEKLFFKVSGLERYAPPHEHHFTCKCGAEHRT